jgi:ABC-type protease/lipase transport system fused ATPase/permease subunit
MFTGHSIILISLYERGHERCLPRSSKVIELQNVSFAYSDGKMVLQDISLDFKKNDLIVIQGKSGAGKSTFLKLFNRFCDTSEGAILFHGKAIEEHGIEEIRSSIIYLPQLPYMIDGSVEENLAFPFSFHAHRGKHYNPGAGKGVVGIFSTGCFVQPGGLEIIYRTEAADYPDPLHPAST